MDTFSYDYLIRSVFDGGRTSKNGANADIYRKEGFIINKANP